MVELHVLGQVIEDATQPFSTSAKYVHHDHFGLDW